MSQSKFQVLWTASAVLDLSALIQYISADSPAAAKRVFSELKRRADNLENLPCQGRVIPELGFFGITGFRELVVPPWRIICRIDGATVWVMAVIGSRRNLEDILLDRFS